MTNIKDIQIPEGWKVLDVKKGLYIKGKAPKIILDNYEKGFINYLSPEYLRGNTKISGYVEIKKSNICYDNDLLILWDGSNAGEIFRGKKGAISSTMVKLTFNNINKEFLYYSFKNSEYIIKSGTKGSGIPHTDKDTIKSINFIIPQSLAEQQKIAKILSTVDEAIQKTDDLIEKYKKIKTGLMKDLFTKGIDTNTGKPHTKFKDSELGRMPESWQLEYIYNILEYEQPDKYLVNSTDYNKNNSIPVLTANKAFILGYTDEKDGIYDKGDVIIFDDFTMDLKYVDFKFKIKSSAIKLLTNINNYNLKFIYYYLINLNLIPDSHKRNYISEVQNLIIHIPKSLQEQQKIVEILSGADEKIEKEQAYKHKLENIKKGLMNDLLTGKVRVKY